MTEYNKNEIFSKFMILEHNLAYFFISSNFVT